ncbi:24410_t:CDS:1, partial [Racocetra persica]
ELYKKESDDVITNFERQAEMMRFGTTSNFINLDALNFINLDAKCFKNTPDAKFFENSSEQIDDTCTTVSTTNEPKTTLRSSFNN